MLALNTCTIGMCSKDLQRERSGAAIVELEMIKEEDFIGTDTRFE